jgi:hypothetical protein
MRGTNVILECNFLSETRTVPQLHTPQTLSTAVVVVPVVMVATVMGGW